MALTVRLDPTLEAALDRYCSQTGNTKSHVVQESLAAYLLPRLRKLPRPASAARHNPVPPTGHWPNPVW